MPPNVEDVLANPPAPNNNLLPNPVANQVVYQMNAQHSLPVKFVQNPCVREKDQPMFCEEPQEDVVELLTTDDHEADYNIWTKDQTFFNLGMSFGGVVRKW